MFKYVEKLIKGMSTQKATFALGCFWEPDDHFSRLKGVLQTTVGYCGGTKKNPAYNDLGDHTESIEIIFDPEKISFNNLLAHFWKSHDPTKTHSTQYKSILFYHTSSQKKEIETSKRQEQKKYEDPIITETKKATFFTKAEDYHQKYLQKLREKNPVHILKKFLKK